MNHWLMVSVDASFAQYAVTPTSSVADKANVTDVLVVDAAPLSIDIDRLDGAVVSVVFSVLVISFLINGKIYLLLSPAPHPVKKAMSNKQGGKRRKGKMLRVTLTTP